MQRFSCKVGLTFIEGQNRWRISRRLATGKLQLESVGGEVTTLSQTDLHERWQSQAWVIDEASIGSLADALYLVVPRDLGTFPEHHQKEAKRRQHYLKHINPEINPYAPESWRLLIEEAARQLEDHDPPSPATVQNWWRRYRSTKSIITLIPYKKPSNGARSRDGYAIFEEVISTLFLVKQKLLKKRVVEEVHRRAQAVSNGLSSAGRIQGPSRSTIYRWLIELQQDVVDKAREGAEAARLKYRVALGNVKVSSVLERLEIDHTPLDLIVIDIETKLPLGRPWLTLATDRYSRMVVGFYISFNAPSSHGVLQCIRQAILPKDNWFARFPDLKNQWPAYGIPELIAVDNGSDLHSDALESACMEMGIQILFCGSKTPQHKGAIERFFRTLNTGLIHQLPGTVFSGVDERGDYPSEDKAVIDMETLVHLIVKWIVDVYNVTPHRGINARPLDYWLQGASGRVIELPVYPQQLEVISGIPAKRTLFHYGIELDGLQYNSEHLQVIRRRTGENTPVMLKYYEDSVGHIHVFDPLAKEYIRVEAKLQEYATSLPRDIHRLVRAQARKRFGDHVQAQQLLEAKAEIEIIIQKALKAHKMGLRKAGARTLMHDSETVLRGTDALAEARRPLKKVRQKAPEELPAGLDDELPDFTFNVVEE